jgi:phenylpropionate dioxygenase-like ring-hydroxylating dioxygenase large terminal subunit
MREGEREAPAANATGFGRGFLRDIWYFAALSKDLKAGRMARQEFLGEPVLLGRTPAGAVVALRDICPHRAAPLWRFGLDGGCVAIPSLTEADAFDLSRVRVRRYPVRESQGMVFIFVAEDARDETPPPPPPVFPGVVGGPPKLTDRMEFAAHIDHAVVGLMDPAHGPFVHQQWWWRSRASMHQKAKRFEPAPEGFVMARHPPSSNSRAYALLGGEPLTEISFRLPGLRWEHVTVGERQVLSLTCLTPLTEAKTRITQIVWSDHPIFALARPLIRAGARRFLKQDGNMVNLQNQGLRYDPTLLWVDDADRQAKWYQALKREWTASRRAGRPFVNPVEAATLRWTS